MRQRGGGSPYYYTLCNSSSSLRLYLDSTHRFLLISLCCTLAHSKALSSVTTGSTRTARATCWETWRAVCLCCCWRRRSWWMARWRSKTCTWNCSGRSVGFFLLCLYLYLGPFCLSSASLPYFFYPFYYDQPLLMLVDFYFFFLLFFFKCLPLLRLAVQ